MKKALFVINTLSRAGAETALLELLRRLEGRDWTVDLLVLTGIGEMRGEIPGWVTLKNKDLIEVSVLSEEGRTELKKVVGKALSSHRTGLRLFPYMFKNAMAMMGRGKILPDKLLWRVLSDGMGDMDETYDLAVAYLEGGSTYYVADHVQAKKKVAFVHVDYAKAGYTKGLDLDCYSKFDRIYAISMEVRESFLEIYPEYISKTGVFQNLLGREHILNMADGPGGFTDSFDGVRILTIGRLTAQKALEVSVQAMKFLKDRGIKARWYVLGEGEQRNSLQRLIQNLGLTEDFLLLGAVNNPYPYLKQTDLYVHASKFEGKSIAIQEAQILGCPILVSDCSGNREQVVDGIDGRMCAFTAKDVADKIEEMLQQKERCIAFGKAASEKMQKDCSGEELIRELLS